MSGLSARSVIYFSEVKVNDVYFLQGRFGGMHINRDFIVNEKV